VRLFHLADTVEVFQRAGGAEAAVEVARARRGTQFDPELVDLFCGAAHEVLADLDAMAELEALMEAEPGLRRQLSERELDAALEAVAGIHGSAAASHAHELRGVVTVPWAVAMAVFIGRDMPKWETTVTKALPNTDRLAPDSFGALVSLAYNRGASFSAAGERYREMRAIRDHLANEQFAEIPDDIRSMKRLWPNVVGLRNRRDHEAILFEKGLAA